MKKIDGCKVLKRINNILNTDGWGHREMVMLLNLYDDIYNGKLDIKYPYKG